MVSADRVFGLRSAGAVAILFPGVFGVACGGDTLTEPREAASLQVEAAGPLVSLGETVQLVATARDAAGAVISVSTTWTALDPGILAVSSSGLATAVSSGSGRVVARAGAAADTATVDVDQRVASVRITPAPPVLELPGDSVVLDGVALDARDNEVADAGPITWGASGSVGIRGGAVIEAVGFGNGTVTATADGASSAVTAEVVGDRFFLSLGDRIRYELDLPDGPGPFPAVAWVHGSGMVDRNAQRIGTDPLVPEGLAALRYDKRGVGESEGVFENVGPTNSFRVLNVLAEDAAAAARFLARLESIDPDRIGLMGNSQAGWIVPQAALKATEVVSFVMLWSGPTVSVGLEIFYSSLTSDPSVSLDEAYAQLGSFNGTPGYDGLADVTALEVPGLWLYGEDDRSIPMRLDVTRLNDLAGQGKPFEVVTFPFGDHALRDTRTGQFFDVWSEYARFLREQGFLDP